MLLHWLADHPEIRASKDEMHQLTKGRPAEMVERLYELAANDRLVGYKAPRDIVKPHTLDLIAKYFPTAALIVGLRHPVDWFESFYNYRAEYNRTLAPADEMIGACTSEMPIEERRKFLRAGGMPSYGVCTDGARFHVHLSMLGKTNVSNPLERELLFGNIPPDTRWYTYRLPFLAPLPNKVFLYDASQLSDDNATRLDVFKDDLGKFLGLKRPIGPPPARESLEEANYNPYRKFPLDICRPQYDELRSALLQHGRMASTWIRTYFIPHPDVTVSSPEHFAQHLSTWEEDPCAMR